MAVEPLPESKPLVVVASSLSSSPSHILFAIVRALLTVELDFGASLRLISILQSTKKMKDTYREMKDYIKAIQHHELDLEMCKRLFSGKLVS